MGKDGNEGEKEMSESIEDLAKRLGWTVERNGTIFRNESTRILYNSFLERIDVERDGICTILGDADNEAVKAIMIGFDTIDKNAEKKNPLLDIDRGDRIFSETEGYRTVRDKTRVSGGFDVFHVYNPMTPEKTEDVSMEDLVARGFRFIEKFVVPKSRMSAE